MEEQFAVGVPFRVQAIRIPQNTAIQQFALQTGNLTPILNLPRMESFRLFQNQLDNTLRADSEHASQST
jgi:hypothetical protein